MILHARALRWCAALLAVATAASCSLGDKQAQADRVVEAVRRTAAGPVTGSVTATVLPRPVKAPAGFEVSDLALDVDLSKIRLPPAEASFTLDNAASRGTLGPVVGGSFPAVLFDDAGIRLRRPDAAPDDARPWLALDYADLVEGSGELAVVEPSAAFGLLAVLDPRLLLDLAAGPLAGSIAVIGTSPSGTVHRRANFDIPKALEDGRNEDYDDKRVEVTKLVLDLLRVSGDVHPGEVWTRSDGRVERFVVRLHIRVERYVQFDLQLDVRIDDATRTSPTTPSRPGADEVVLVDSLVPLRQAAAAAAPELATLLPQGLPEGVLGG